MLESEEIELDELSDRTDVRGSVGGGSLVFVDDGLFFPCEWCLALFDELKGLRLRRCLSLVPSLDLACDLDAVDALLLFSMFRRLWDVGGVFASLDIVTLGRCIFIGAGRLGLGMSALEEYSA